MKSVFMEELSWVEIQDAMEQGVDTVLICAASQEQHGPHLAENTDYIIGHSLCGMVARRLGNTLAAPVIRPGLSVHHMGHPGSLTLRPEIFRGIVEDYVSCYIKHGFQKIILCSSHGGNFNTMEDLAQTLSPRYPGTTIVNALTFSDFQELWVQADRMYQLEDGVCGGHACCFETSIMLAVRPDCVSMDRAAAGVVSADRTGVADRLFREGMTALSPNGIIGDPTRSTAEMGTVFLEMLCSLVCRIAREKLGRRQV